MTSSDAAGFSKSLRWLAGLIAALCWGALALQLNLIIAETARRGFAWPIALGVYASFFTIQVNLLAAIVTSFVAAGINRWPARGRIRTAIAVYLSVGGIVFFVSLRPVWQHTGPQALADALLHYVIPALYCLFWFLRVPKHDLRWRDAVVWMIYPTAYLAAVLAFGLWSGYFPYPFIDLRSRDVLSLVTGIAGSSGGFLMGGLLAVALGRFTASR
jgi:hypothetical protein